MAEARTQRLTDEQLEALLEVVFVVCLPDGEFGSAELARLRERLVQLEDGRLRSERVDGLMLRAAVQLEKSSPEARLEHAARVLGDPTARRIALALAIEIANADGLQQREREAARAVAEAFEIDDVDALLPA